MTTFHSAFNRYCFLHLPFGLVCRQDVFQHKMDQILKYYEESSGMVDYLMIHGHTDARLCKVTQAVGNMAWFSTAKGTVKATSIKVFGCIYKVDQIHLDSAKGSTIHNMEAPKNEMQLQELLGMITYSKPLNFNLLATLPHCMSSL